MRGGRAEENKRLLGEGRGVRKSLVLESRKNACGETHSAFVFFSRDKKKKKRKERLLASVRGAPPGSKKHMRWTEFSFLHLVKSCWKGRLCLPRFKKVNSGISSAAGAVRRLGGDREHSHRQEGGGGLEAFSSNLPRGLRTEPVEVLRGMAEMIPVISGSQLHGRRTQDHLGLVLQTKRECLPFEKGTKHD